MNKRIAVLTVKKIRAKWLAFRKQGSYRVYALVQREDAVAAGVGTRVYAHTLGRAGGGWAIFCVRSKRDGIGEMPQKQCLCNKICVVRRKDQGQCRRMRNRPSIPCAPCGTQYSS